MSVQDKTKKLLEIVAGVTWLDVGAPGIIC